MRTRSLVMGSLFLFAASTQAGPRTGVWSFGANAAYHSYAMTDINTALKSTGASISNGIQYGGQFNFGLTPNLEFGLGMDYLGAQCSFNNSAGRTITHSFPMLSIAVLGSLVLPDALPGLDLKLNAAFTADSLTGAMTSGGTGGDISYVATGTGAFVSAGAEYFVSPSFSLGPEVGYRMSSLSPLKATDATGTYRLINANGSDTSLDYSGLCARFNMVYHYGGPRL